MSRSRSQCVFKKRNTITEINITEEDESAEINHGIETSNKVNLQPSHFQKNIHAQINNQNCLKHLKLAKPVFRNIEKVYPSKSSKTVQINEKAQIVGSMNKSMMIEIEKHNQLIDFERFLSKFKHEDELRNLELTDILDIDYEKLHEIKIKATEFIDVTSSVLLEMEQKGETANTESELLLFFYQKLQEIQNNEINIQIFANNLKRVKGVAYNSTGVKLYFKFDKKK